MARKYSWICGSGRLVLQLTMEDARIGHHQGQCDGDVEYLCDLTRIKSQTAEWDAADLAEELRGYGAWSAEELQDHEQNIRRMVWLACGDITENPKDYRD